MMVPEDRDQKDSPMIEVHFAIIRSSNPDKAPDPLVGLMGGPGVRSLDSIEYWQQLHNQTLIKRDVIVLDQRGVGYSQPSLDCAEAEAPFYPTYAQDISMAEQNQHLIQALRSCRDRLVQEGANLNAYTSAASAADVEDLRRALGYAEWNLYGGSYGTRWALTVMRDFPEGLRSVILEAVHPPQEDLFTGIGVNIQRALDLLFERCAMDAECNQACPDLEQVFYQTVEQLDAAPVTLSIRRPKDSQPYEIVINGDRLIRGFLDLLTLTEVLPHLPGLIYEVHAGEWDSFASMIHWTQFPFDELSEGLYFSVECGEEAPFGSPEELAANEAVLNPRLRSAMNNEAAYQICQAWAVSPADEIENQAVVSDIPTLILVGEHDPLTPPEWGRSTAENLSQAQYFEFPGVSHGVLPLSLDGGKCSSSQIVEDFLDDPTSPVEASCVAEVPVLFGSD